MLHTATVHCGVWNCEQSTPQGPRSLPPVPVPVLPLVLVLVVSVKYLGLILRADNQGEGGILSLMSLVQKRGAGGQRHLARGLRVTGCIGGERVRAGGHVKHPVCVVGAHAGGASAAELRGRGDIYGYHRHGVSFVLQQHHPS